MKRLYWVCSIALLVVLCQKSYGQYAFSTFPPPTVFSMEDLWHFNLSGPPNMTHDQFYVVLQVYDGKSQQLLLSSTTSTFDLNAGSFYVNKLNLTGIKPINTQFTGNNSMLASLVGNGGLFPAGSYRIRYTLMGRNKTTQTFEELEQQQLEQVVDLLFPPTLLTPFDNDSIDEFYPVFTWAPSFSGGGERISYDITIVEELPGQSAEQAINSNPYYYYQDNLTSTSLTYPVSAPKLRVNQWYDWRVTAKVNGQPMARSESWRFIIVAREGEEEPDFQNNCYAIPKLELDAGYWRMGDEKLKVLYVEDYHRDPGSILDFNIYDMENNVVYSDANVSVPVTYGFNYLSIFLPQANVPKNKFYVFEAIDPKGRKTYLRIYTQYISNTVPPGGLGQ